jgi:hypothetical protein
MRIFPASRAGRLLGLLALAVLLPAAGCGKGTGTVTGTVSYKGNKLKGGYVIFTPEDGKGQGCQASIMEDGTYTAEKCPGGKMKVSVKTSYLKPSAGGGPKYERPKDMPGGAEGGNQYVPPDPAEKAKKYVWIPEKYEEPGTSGLTFEVKGGSQTYPIDLQ